jgi:hypothetical protein
MGEQLTSASSAIKIESLNGPPFIGIVPQSSESVTRSLLWVRFHPFRTLQSPAAGGIQPRRERGRGSGGGSAGLAAALGAPAVEE